MQSEILAGSPQHDTHHKKFAGGDAHGGNDDNECSDKMFDEPASFDTDARNIGFLNSILSVMPPHLQSVPETVSYSSSVPININYEAHETSN